MKNIKTFETKAELNEVVKVMESNGIGYEIYDNLVLQVHVSDFIKAGDLIIEWQS